MVALSKSSDRIKQLERENQDLLYEIDRLRTQNDIYRFGREEAPKWKSALDVGVEILDQRIEEKKRLLDDLDLAIQRCRKDLAVLFDRIKMQKTAVMSFKYSREQPPVATKLNLQRAMEEAVKKTPYPQPSLNTHAAMTLIKKLFLGYTFDGQVFRFNGQAQNATLTIEEVETLLRRSLR